MNRARPLLFATTLLCLLGCQKVSSVHEDAKGPSVAEIRTHTLAFGAILDTQNGYCHSALEIERGKPTTDDERQSIRKLLGDSWRVNSREDLLSLLAKMQNGENGHRADYWEIRHSLVTARMENYYQVLFRSKSTEEAAQVLIVATHLRPVRGTTLPITAWDFGRYINLCRWGYVAGWLSEPEAWNRILPAARLLQASYGSWNEFAADYLVGRNFWNPGAGSQNDRIRYWITLLNLPPSGLWSTIPWDQSMGQGVALTDTYAQKHLASEKEPGDNDVSMDFVHEYGPRRAMMDASADTK